MAASLSSPSLTNPPLSLTLPSIGVRLNNTNCLLWKTRSKPFLRAYQILDHVEGKSVSPPPTLSDDGDKASTTPNPAFQSRILRDRLALGWILNSIEDSIVPQLIGIDYSHDAWTTLECHYSQQNQARVMQLRNEFSQLQKGSSSMIEYLNRAKLIVDNLATIGRPLSNDEIVSRLIFGLRPEYIQFCKTLNATGTSHTMDSLHGLLLTKEADQQLDQPALNISPTASAMVNFTLASSNRGCDHGGGGRSNSHFSKNRGRGQGGYNDGGGREKSKFQVSGI